MTHHEVNYGKLDLSREAKDEAAIKDFESYVGEKTWLTLVEAAAFIEQVACGYVESDGSLTLNTLDMQLRIMAGVSGYPLQAFYRKHCLRAWLNWCNEPPLLHVDEQGFPIESADALPVSAGVAKP